MVDEGLNVFHNPANIQNTKFDFALAKWLYSTNLFSLGGTFDNYSFGISYLNYGTIQGYNEYGVATAAFTPFNIRFAIGRKFGPFGIALKAFEEKIADYSLYGICSSLSSYVKLGKIAVGAKIDNLGKEFAQNTDIPIVAALGAKFTLPKNIAFLIESKYPNLEVNAGLLYQYQNIQILFGSRYLTNTISNQTFSSSDLSFTAGLIVEVENYGIGYSFVYTQFSTAYQFSITFSP